MSRPALDGIETGDMDLGPPPQAHGLGDGAWLIVAVMGPNEIPGRIAAGWAAPDIGWGFSCLRVEAPDGAVTYLRPASIFGFRPTTRDGAATAWARAKEQGIAFLIEVEP